MEKVAQKQKELNEEASRLPVHESQKLYEHARQSMNRAQQALDHNDPEQAKRQQNEAADAFQQLAQKLPANAPATAKAPTGEAEAPHGLPNKEQTAQARELAKEQRELRDQVRRATEEARARRPLRGTIPSANWRSSNKRWRSKRLKSPSKPAKSAATTRRPRTKPARRNGSAQKAAGEMKAGALPAAKEAGKQAAQQTAPVGEATGPDAGRRQSSGRSGEGGAIGGETGGNYS